MKAVPRQLSAGAPRGAVLSLLAALAVVTAAVPAVARTTAVGALPAVPARVARMPALGGVVRLADAAFAGGVVGAVVGQRCAQTSGTDCTGFVARTTNGGATWRGDALGGFTATAVAISRDGRVWVWLQDLGCSTGDTCTSRLATAAAGLAFRTVLTTREAPDGILAQSGGRALVALNACPRNASSTAQCLGRLAATTNAGRTWHSVWRGTDWIGGLASGSGVVWAFAVHGLTNGGIRVAALRSASLAGPFHARGTVADIPYAGGVAYGLSASAAVAAAGPVWLALSDTLSCAMHGCGVSGLYRSVDGGRSWRAVAWPGAAGGCVMPAPLVTAWGDRVLATMTRNLAACPPPGAVFVGAQAGSEQATVVSTLAFGPVHALGGLTTGRVWAVTTEGLLVSSDGGRHWQPLWPALAPATAVQFVTPAFGMGLGTAMHPGDVLVSHDGGAAWRLVGRVPVASVSALDVVSRRVAFVAGAAFPNPGFSDIWRSGDGGRSWHKVAGVEGTVLALRLDPAGGGLVVAAAFSGDATQLERLVPGARLPRRVQFVAQAPVSAAIAPNGTAYVATSASPGGGSLLAVSGKGTSTLAVLPAMSDALVSAAGNHAAAALSASYVPTGGSRVFGYASRTEVLGRDAGGTWRLVRMPDAAGAPAAVDFLDATRGWLITSGEPGVPLLWTTADGGLSWTVLTP